MLRFFVGMLAVLCGFAFAQGQQNQRIRGTIAEARGDVLVVKTRDGRTVEVQLAPDAQVATTRKVGADHFKPGSYVGVTSVQGPDGRLVARRVHALGPQVPQGHMAWESLPDSMMTNANIAASAQVTGGNELTLKYKDGEQKILVTPQTEYFDFAPGTRADLKPGETIFTNARVVGDGKFSTQRLAVSKDGVTPPQ